MPSTSLVCAWLFRRTTSLRVRRRAAIWADLVEVGSAQQRNGKQGALALALRRETSGGGGSVPMVSEGR